MEMSSYWVRKWATLLCPQDLSGSLTSKEGNVVAAEVHLNIKIPSYQYRDCNYKYETFSRPSNFYDGNRHTWKAGLYIETHLVISRRLEMVDKMSPLPLVSQNSFA